MRVGGRVAVFLQGAAAIVALLRLALRLKSGWRGNVGKAIAFCMLLLWQNT